jgi:hypothetical protein
MMQGLTHTFETQNLVGTPKLAYHSNHYFRSFIAKFPTAKLQGCDRAPCLTFNPTLRNQFRDQDPMRHLVAATLRLALNGTVSDR